MKRVLVLIIFAALLLGIERDAELKARLWHVHTGEGDFYSPNEPIACGSCVHVWSLEANNFITIYSSEYVITPPKK